MAFEMPNQRACKSDVADAGSTDHLMCRTSQWTYVAWSSRRFRQEMSVCLARVASEFDVYLYCPRSGKWYDVREDVLFSMFLLRTCITSSMLALDCAVDILLVCRIMRGCVR